MGTLITEILGSHVAKIDFTVELTFSSVYLSIGEYNNSYNDPIPNSGSNGESPSSKIQNII